MAEENKGTEGQPEEKKDIVNPESTEVATAVNKKDLGFGQADDRGLLIIPRAKLLQGASPEAKDVDSECKVGDIINSLTKEELPEFFVPILFSTSWIRFNPKEEDKPGYDSNYELGAIIWRATSKTDPDYKDEETLFGPDGEKPLAIQFLNFFSFFPGHNMPVIVSFAKTSFKAGRELYSLCKAMPEAPYAYRYRLGHQTKTGPTGDDYLIFTVTMAGKNEGEDYNRSHELAMQFQAKIDQMVPHEEEAAAAEEAEGGDIPF